jgi:hypothetical protein
MIGQNPIQFLWHIFSVRPKARLNVHHRDAHLCSSQRTGQGGVRVAKDKHEVWPLLEQYLLQCHEHPARLHSM